MVSYKRNVYLFARESPLPIVQIRCVPLVLGHLVESPGASTFTMVASGCFGNQYFDQEWRFHFSL